MTKATVARSVAGELHMEELGVFAGLAGANWAIEAPRAVSERSPADGCPRPGPEGSKNSKGYRSNAMALGSVVA